MNIAIPEKKTRRKPQRVYGPYRVKNIGVDGDVWEIVGMVNNHDSRTWEELRPRVTYAGKEKRQTAYAKCLRLNKRWNQDMLESMRLDLIEYWEKATN